jgi:hypothetical protein
MESTILNIETQALFARARLWLTGGQIEPWSPMFWAVAQAYTNV